MNPEIKQSFQNLRPIATRKNEPVETTRRDQQKRTPAPPLLAADSIKALRSNRFPIQNLKNVELQTKQNKRKPNQKSSIQQDFRKRNSNDDFYQWQAEYGKIGEKYTIEKIRLASINISRLPHAAHRKAWNSLLAVCAHTSSQSPKEYSEIKQFLVEHSCRENSNLLHKAIFSQKNNHFTSGEKLSMLQDKHALTYRQHSDEAWLELYERFRESKNLSTIEARTYASYFVDRVLKKNDPKLRKKIFNEYLPSLSEADRLLLRLKVAENLAPEDASAHFDAIYQKSQKTCAVPDHIRTEIKKAYISYALLQNQTQMQKRVFNEILPRGPRTDRGELHAHAASTLPGVKQEHLQTNYAQTTQAILHNSLTAEEQCWATRRLASSTRLIPTKFSWRIALTKRLLSKLRTASSVERKQSQAQASIESQQHLYASVLNMVAEDHQKAAFLNNEANRNERAVLLQEVQTYLKSTQSSPSQPGNIARTVRLLAEANRCDYRKNPDKCLNAWRGLTEILSYLPAHEQSQTSYDLLNSYPCQTMVDEAEPTRIRLTPEYLEATQLVLNEARKSPATYTQTVQKLRHLSDHPDFHHVLD